MSYNITDYIHPGFPFELNDRERSRRN